MTLLDRIIAAEGPDRALDAEIAKLFGAEYGSREEVHYETRSVYYHAEVAPRYTASIDAALTLQPEGWMVTHLSELGGAGGCVCGLGNPGTGQDVLADHGERTMALALLAAILRAERKDDE